VKTEREGITAPDQERMMKAREEVQEHDDNAAMDNPLHFEQADHWTYPTGARLEQMFTLTGIGLPRSEGRVRSRIRGRSVFP
jgi:hypothetical protein